MTVWILTVILILTIVALHFMVTQVNTKTTKEEFLIVFVPVFVLYLFLMAEHTTTEWYTTMVVFLMSIIWVTLGYAIGHLVSLLK